LGSSSVRDGTQLMTTGRSGGIGGTGYFHESTSRCTYSPRSGRWEGSGNEFICNDGTVENQGAPWGCLGRSATNWTWL
jgi:hypothetical protein